MREIESVPLERLEPVRKFAFFKRQRRNPGWYWSSTTGGLIPYESRLELARLILADFDSRVRWIVAQPLRLHWRAEGRERSHVPDYLLLLRDGRREILNVKTSYAAGRPEFREKQRVCEVAAKRVSWRARVETEPDPILLSNLRFISGARGEHWAVPRYGEAVLAAAAEPLTIGELERRVGPKVLVRPAVLHLIWHHRLTADLSKPLEERTVVRTELEAS